MAPKPIKPHDASLLAEQEKCLVVDESREVVRLKAEDTRIAVISAVHTSSEAFSTAQRDVHVNVVEVEWADSVRSAARGTVQTNCKLPARSSGKSWSCGR